MKISKNLDIEEKQEKCLGKGDSPRSKTLKANSLIKNIFNKSKEATGFFFLENYLFTG